ncbi:hypothetical protein BVY04_02200 [bacterium M21]|nr:hypothetical protein BVY04_02200 [bacterium M21]
MGDADDKSFATDWLADKAVVFIERHKDEPFCFMLSLPDPHGPDTVRTPCNTMYEDLKFEEPRTASKDRSRAPTWACPKGGRAN